VSRLIVGVDPGSRNTGVVVRQGIVLVDFETVIRVGSEDLPLAGYLQEVLRVVLGFWQKYVAELVAIEAVVAPSPFQGRESGPGFSNLDGILGTAMVVGAVEGFFPHAIRVQPARMGQAPLSTYPDALRPRAGKGKGKDKLRHVRSAWDVAGAAEGAARIAKAVAL
jgi:hypothetical protein